MAKRFKGALTIAMFITLGCSACYAAMTGKVIDAKTQQPIEGAVVLVEWTKTKGVPGMTHTESAKVIEVVSDKDGKVTISGNLDPFAEPPHVTVYKKGYVAWNNEYIFPNYRKRTDFKWENGYKFSLEKFRPEYTHDAHVTFIRSTYSFGLGANSSFEKAWDWEAVLALKEIKSKK